jgi:pSer/pThr/pTyr-binding forkhead associated (FHA) protein
MKGGVTVRDGLTLKRRSRAADAGGTSFLQRHRTKLVLVNTSRAGEEYPIDRERMILGRGPGVDLTFDDSAMSRQHASIEIDEGGPKIRDLGSTNGLLLNGHPVQAAELGNGDRIEIGRVKLQLVVEARLEEPEIFEISTETHGG